MLPIGLHLSFWQTKWDDDLEPLIIKTKEAGFDLCEFPLLALDQIPLGRIRKALDDNAMKASCSVGLNQSQDVTSPHGQIRKQGIQFLRKCLEAARTLDSPVLVGVTYAPWGYFPDDDLIERRKNSILSMKEAALIAQDLNVTLCLEVVNRFEGYLINTVAQGLEFLHEVNHSSIKLHLDTFHMNIEEDDIAGAIQLAGDQLGHIHFAANNRKSPGRGHLDWDSLFVALQKIKYKNYVVAEVFVNPAGEVGRGLSTWRPLAYNLVQTAEETALFLKKELSNVQL
ncbi:MAG: sugar phosphate isomerase/epimerase [Pelolinea sp.]|jgi:D-psicose/D-tagatose/L-ribulose 3-epimerase|nr:sugar phosphate isomerase/epimerase [Pelolinea sp.]